MSAVYQPGAGSLSGRCLLSSAAAAADRRLLLWTEMLNAGRVRSVEAAERYSHETTFSSVHEKV